MANKQYVKYRRSIDNKMRSYGETDLDKRHIKINKKKAKNDPTYKRPVNKHASRYPDVLDTIIHEETHAKHPKMHEKNVRKHARKMVKKLGSKAKRKLYKLYA